MSHFGWILASYIWHSTHCNAWVMSGLTLFVISVISGSARAVPMAMSCKMHAHWAKGGRKLRPVSLHLELHLLWRGVFSCSSAQLCRSQGGAKFSVIVIWTRADWRCRQDRHLLERSFICSAEYLKVIKCVVLVLSFFVNICIFVSVCLYICIFVYSYKSKVPVLPRSPQSNAPVNTSV